MWLHYVVMVSPITATVVILFSSMNIFKSEFLNKTLCARTSLLQL